MLTNNIRNTEVKKYWCYPWFVETRTSAPPIVIIDRFWGIGGLNDREPSKGAPSL
jgi:hypothetical protein